jgi:hypothetical protein
MRSFVLILCLGICGLFAVSERLRLEGVLYLNDILERPIELRATRATYMTFTRDGTSILGTILEGQKVQVVGLSDYRYLVAGRLRGGVTEGWVVPSDFEAISEATMKEINAKREHAEKIKAAIARGEIMIGMTQEMVEKILGSPGSKSQILDERGAFDQWTYTAYKSIPYQVPGSINGTNFMSVLYRKVPTGSKVVTFQDKKVIRFESKTEDPVAVKEQGGVVVPPLFVR